MVSSRECRTRTGLITFIVLSILGYGGSVWWRLAAESRDPEPPLLVRQVAPTLTEPSESTVSLAKPGEKREYTFQLTNQSALPLEGLRIGVSCQCQVSIAPASHLRPGETTQCSLTLQAPRVGESRTRIPITVSGQTDAVASIDVVMRVDVQPPVLSGKLVDLQLEAISGVPFVRDFLIETIEEEGSDRWVEGLKFVPTDLIAWRLRDFQEKQAAGTNFVRRTYRFELMISGEARTQRGMYQLTYAHNPDPEQHFRDLMLTTHDPVSVFPNPITVSTGKVTQAIVIIRSSDYRVSLGEASQGLSVMSQSAMSSKNTFAFDVQVENTPEVVFPGKIQLICRNGSAVDTREIPVELFPNAVLP